MTSSRFLPRRKKERKSLACSIEAAHFISHFVGSQAVVCVHCMRVHTIHCDVLVCMLCLEEAHGVNAVCVFVFNRDSNSMPRCTGSQAEV